MGVIIGFVPKEKLSFEEYFNRYYPQVQKYILKKVSDIQTAEDLAMSSFASCWEKFSSFDPAKASFQTWLYVIVNNKLKNYYRDKKVFVDIDDIDESFDGFEDELTTAEYMGYLRNHLADALESLSEIQRSIVIQKYYQNKDSNEIALEVGLTPGNVRVQLTRAIKKLKQYFDEKNIKWEN